MGIEFNDDGTVKMDSKKLNRKMKEYDERDPNETSADRKRRAEEGQFSDLIDNPLLKEFETRDNAARIADLLAELRMLTDSRSVGTQTNLKN